MFLFPHDPGLSFQLRVLIEQHIKCSQTRSEFRRIDCKQRAMTHDEQKTGLGTLRLILLKFRLGPHNRLEERWSVV
jgi:hypothetical protein